MNLALKVPRWTDTDWGIVRAERAKDPPTPYAEIAKMLSRPRNAHAIKTKRRYEDYAAKSGHARGAGRRPW